MKETYYNNIKVISKGKQDDKILAIGLNYLKWPLRSSEKRFSNFIYEWHIINRDHICAVMKQ